MSIPNVNQITSTLRMMNDTQLAQYAAMHKADPYIFPMAFEESNMRKQVRAREQAKTAGQPQQNVADQALAAMAPQPQMAPQGMPPQGGPQMAQRQLPEQQGIGALPVKNMQNMADGGIAGYADGGESQFNYSGGSDGPLMNMSGGGEPVVRMADGGIARFQVGGSIESKYQQESMEMGDGRRMQYSPDVQAYARSQEDASKSSYAERERKNMLAGGRPSPLVLQPTNPLAAPAAPAPATPAANYSDATAPRAKDYLPSAAPDNKQPPPPNLRPAGPSTPAAPAAPEKSAAARLMDVQKEVGAGDRTAIDAKQNLLEKSMLSGATEEQTNLEKDIAARPKYGEAKEARLAEREAGLGKEKDTLVGLAALETALGLISTPGPFMNALGSSAQKGLKTYGEGIAKLKLAKEKIDDSRDQIDEFRRTESNMTAKERRDAANNINRTKIAIEQLGVAGLEKAYGLKAAEATTVFNAATQEGLTKQEIQGRKDVALIGERGNMARAAMPTGEMRTAMMLGTGTTDAQRLESGMKKLQEITADKSGMAAVSTLAKINAEERKNGEQLTTMQDLLGSARQYATLMYPKVADVSATRERPR